MTRITSTGNVAWPQYPAILLELDKRVRKALHLADVFNEEYFRRDNAIVKSMRVHTPMSTVGPLSHK
jgi:hypothetical protein